MCEFEPKVVIFAQLWLKLVIFYGNPICQRAFSFSAFVTMQGNQPCMA
jgi:hypothetical protein